MVDRQMLRTVIFLQHQHRRLERIFRLHQIALVGGKPRRALALLQGYRRLLHVHTQQEEQLFDAALGAGLPTRWPVRTYRAEHQKLFALIDSLCDKIVSLPDKKLPALCLVALIEREKTIKGVAEHHQAREEQDLYELLPQLYENPGAPIKGDRSR